MRCEEESSESPPDIRSVSTVMSDSVIGIFVGLVHPLLLVNYPLPSVMRTLLVAYLSPFNVHGNETSMQF